MVQPMSDDQKPLDPEAAAAIGKVRRMMIIIMTVTFVAIGLVLAVIGYRLSQVKESTPSFTDVSHVLPPGAKVLSTATSNDHIVVTIEVGGAVQLLTFDPDTLKPLGRLRLEPKP
jgi:heme/copper-type cytochrome/quinol oxidase subunit 2